MGVGCVKMELMESSSPDLIKDQPDADNIKMFVGQIPKTWDETRLRQMFEQFGPVHTLNVLRDKVTSISRGESLKMEALAPGHTVSQLGIASDKDGDYKQSGLLLSPSPFYGH